jgi:hypothetical protein
MSKKFQFIQGQLISNKNNDDKSDCVSIDEYNHFKLIFESDGDSNVVYEGRRTQPIVRSEIQESIKIQLKNIIDEIKDNGKELLYFKMNQATKNRLRTFYSYEVSFVPKNLTEQDKKVGKIVGTIAGIKIVEDQSIEGMIIIPLIKTRKEISKRKFLNYSLNKG